MSFQKNIAKERWDFVRKNLNMIILQNNINVPLETGAAKKKDEKVNNFKK